MPTIAMLSAAGNRRVRCEQRELRVQQRKVEVAQRGYGSERGADGDEADRDGDRADGALRPREQLRDAAARGALGRREGLV